MNKDQSVCTTTIQPLFKCLKTREPVWTQATLIGLNQIRGQESPDRELVKLVMYATGLNDLHLHLPVSSLEVTPGSS